MFLEWIQHYKFLKKNIYVFQVLKIYEISKFFMLELWQIFSCFRCATKIKNEHEQKKAIF